MANPFRSETDLKTPLQVYPLRLTMNDWALLQNELGYGIYEMADRIGKAKFGVVEIASVMRRALRSGGYQFPNQRAGEVVAKIMEQAGLPTCLQAMMDLLSAALSDPNDTQPKQEDPAPAEQTALFKEETTDPL